MSGSLYGMPVYRSRGAADATLLAPPPFSFPGVTARVFPLRANMNILRSFCKSYLNVAPEVCEFHPYLPYVLFVVLDYGRMAAEEVNLGWVSQHEIFFAVPLGKWGRTRRGGPRTFQGWVVNTPFIFVDDPTSLSTGREIYGWPKVLVALHPGLEEWLVDPRNPTRLLTLDVKGFGRHETGGERLLEIDQRMGQNPSLFPPDFEMVDPFERLSRLTRTSWSVGWGLAQLSLRAPLAGFGPQDPAGRGMVLLESLRQLLGFYQEPRVEALTLKQFPDSEHPSQICYQALVQSRMSVARYNRGGLLGLPNVLQGDITGGFRIRLRENPAFPIVASLGLEVARERTVDRRALSILEPFFPFWMSVDLNYGKGETICWRMRGSPWFREGVPVPGHGPTPAKARYNTFAGAAQQVWNGPFLVPGIHCDVFPLRADPDPLRRFIEGYLNVDDRYRFVPWGRHVYMVASAGRMFSNGRSGAWIESCMISFNVPLAWYEGGCLRGFAVTRPFVFVDNPTLAMTMREVEGVPAMDATIETPRHSWLVDGPVLQMKAAVFSVLDAGLQSEQRTLIEVMAEDPMSAGASPLEDGSRRDPCLDRARRILCGRERLQMLALKQFRDVEEPHGACYQALVVEPWTLLNPKVTRLSRRAIRLYRYPSLPLVDTLGLRTSSMLPPQEMEGAIADLLEPRNPFRMELRNLEIGLSKGISHTAGTLPWQPFHPEPAVDEPGCPQASELAAILTTCTPQRALKAVLDCVDRHCDPCAEGAASDPCPGKRRL